jgi:hypothetical protein
MRWIKNEIDDGDTRKRSKFLWWPLTIGTETRWLERVTLEYVYRPWARDIITGGVLYDPRWIPNRFLTV